MPTSCAVCDVSYKRFSDLLKHLRSKSDEPHSELLTTLTNLKPARHVGKISSEQTPIEDT